MAFFDRNWNIVGLEYGEIFVFGSNKAGRHGIGAAKTALRWGAVYGKGEGIMGNTYALPTKDKELNTLSLHEIELNLDNLYKAARSLKNKNFLLTAIGTGYAGIEEGKIKDLVQKLMPPPNVIPWYSFRSYASLCLRASAR